MSNITNTLYKKAKRNTLTLSALAMCAVLLVGIASGCHHTKKITAAPVAAAEPPVMEASPVVELSETGENIAEIIPVFEKGLVANAAAAPQNAWIRSEKDLSEFCLKNKIKMPDGIDFEFKRSDLVVVYAGQKPSGGYAVVIDKVVAGKDQIAVYYTNFAPGTQCASANVLTYPIATARIPKNETVRNIKFLGTKATKICD